MSLTMGNLDVKAGTGASIWSTRKPLIWDCEGILGGTLSGGDCLTSGMFQGRSWSCRTTERSFLHRFPLRRFGLVSVVFMSVISGSALLCALAIRVVVGLKLARNGDR